MPLINKKNILILVLSVFLILGFLSISIVSYFFSLSSLRNQIITEALPLTSDNVYSEIQRDLLQPVFISGLMANNTFLRDWVIEGEMDELKIRKYLKKIMTEYKTFTSFFVSEKTRIYYHADGILKNVAEDEKRDLWYFRIRELKEDYEINVDPDMANEDATTIFINYKVFDDNGNLIGVTGVGMTVYSLNKMMKDYSTRYNRNIYFIDSSGKIILHSNPDQELGIHIDSLEGVAEISKQMINIHDRTYIINRDGAAVHINSRFVPELNWSLIIEQSEKGATGGIDSALYFNAAMYIFITIVILVITIISVNTYQKITVQQQDKLLAQKKRIEKALVNVKKLSGLLPICASCKKVRNDKGYWQQIESYISEHSEADFSHGICPECAVKLYKDVEL